MTRSFGWLVFAFAVAPAFGQTSPPPPQRQTPKATNESGQSNQNAQDQSNQKTEQQNQQSGQNQQTYPQRNQNSANQKDRDSNNSADANQDRNDAQPRIALRPKDLRAPDIGLWFDRKSRDGLVISDVSTKGPIAKLGFKEGDRIVSVNGKRVSREADFIDDLLSNNRRVDVIVTRDGREATIQVDPTLLVEDYGATEVDPLEQLGIVVDDRYNDRIVVWRVIPRSPAYYSGIRSGDVLATFDARKLGSRQEFEKSVATLNPGEVDVEVRRGDRTRDLTVDVPRFETRGERRTAMRPNIDNRDARRNDRTDEQRVTPLRPNK